MSIYEPDPALTPGARAGAHARGDEAPWLPYLLQLALERHEGATCSGTEPHEHRAGLHP